MLVAFLIITCLILSTLLGISVYYNYKFGKIIINVEDTIESSLDELDVIYGRISKILEIPVFFDSVEVRQVIADIEIAQQTILKIAGSLTQTLRDNDDTQEEDS
jgi:hypothetical protein